MKGLEQKQQLLKELIEFADEQEAIDPEEGYILLMSYYSEIHEGLSLSAPSLERLTDLCQQLIHLPVYTIKQAAAMAGITPAGIEWWIYKRKGLQTMLPGKQHLIADEELRRFLGRDEEEIKENV